MTTLADFTKYDHDRAMFKEFSILTDGKKDYYGNGFDRMGRRHIMRLNTFNDQGTQISVWMYITDITRAIKSGALTVYVK